jgi:hypothetical protein
MEVSSVFKMEVKMKKLIMFTLLFGGVTGLVTAGKNNGVQVYKYHWGLSCANEEQDCKKRCINKGYTSSKVNKKYRDSEMDGEQSFWCYQSCYCLGAKTTKKAKKSKSHGGKARKK